ncbi:MAG: LamG domain-containing protein [Candidatus Sumerlaeia bacterium]
MDLKCIKFAIIAMGMAAILSAPIHSTAQHNSAPTTSTSSALPEISVGPIDMTEEKTESAQPDAVATPHTKIDDRLATYSKINVLPIIPITRHYYSFDETEGKRAQDTLSGQDAYLMGENIRRATGFLDSGILLNGRNDFVNLGCLDIAGNDFTLAAWIKPRAVVEENYRIIIAKERAFTNRNRFRFYLGDRNLLGFAMSDEKNRDRLLVESPKEMIETNRWTHVAVTRYGPHFTLLVNGEIVAEKTVHGTLLHQNQVDMRIGASYPRTGSHKAFRPFEGLIDEVLIQQGAIFSMDLQKRVQQDKKYGWRKFAEWSPIQVEMYWKPWTAQAGEYVNEAGKYEMFFHQLQGHGSLEIRGLKAWSGAQDEIPIESKDDRFYHYTFQIEEAPDTFLITSQMRMQERHDSMGEVLIRRLGEDGDVPGTNKKADADSKQAQE